MAEPFILFDLDNTLYPADSGLMCEMDRRMTLFVAEYLSMDFETAEANRRAREPRFGTTLEWLRGLHGLEDPEPYLRTVHPADVERLIPPDPGLREFLANLPNGFALFTNSPLEHAQRTLDALGVSDLFSSIWDLRRMGFKGKPSRKAYDLILGDLGLRPSEALLVDDNRDNLEAFSELGGNVFDPGLRGPSSWIDGLAEHMEALDG
jgi:putative hydrolase of the HAD superfamily